jgi:hypothetical protein
MHLNEAIAPSKVHVGGESMVATALALLLWFNCGFGTTIKPAQRCGGALICQC